MGFWWQMFAWRGRVELYDNKRKVVESNSNDQLLWFMRIAVRWRLINDMWTSWALAWYLKYALLLNSLTWCPLLSWSWLQLGFSKLGLLGSRISEYFVRPEWLRIKFSSVELYFFILHPSFLKWIGVRIKALCQPDWLCWSNPCKQYSFAPDTPLWFIFQRCLLHRFWIQRLE